MKRTISEKGLNLIKEFEGCELTAYFDVENVITVGFGHTGTDVYPGMVITKEHADSLLKQDIKWAEAAVNEYVKVEITQGIFDALTSFTFNCGAGALQSSTLLKLLNQHNYAKAGSEILKWDKGSNGPIAGLTRRRRAEQKLFYSQPFPPVGLN